MDTYGYFYVTALELATSQNHNKTKQNRLFVGQLVLVRLFSEAGMLLTKQRRRMLPKIMKKLVYIRYEKKYRKWIDRLGISVSKEELKKGLEEEEDVEELDEDMIE